MALSRTTVHNSRSGEDHGTGSWTTASFTPPSNSLLVVALALMENGGTTDPTGDATVSGGGWTYSRRRDESDLGAWSGGVVIWTAPITTGASMTLTFDCGARNIYNYAVSVVAYEGYDTSSPVGATGGLSNPASLDGAQSFLLDAEPADGSEVFAALFSDTGNTSTPATGWTEIHDLQQTAGTGIQSQVRAAAPGAMLQVGNALGGTTTTTSFTITTPAVLAEGDLMELQFTHRGTGDGTVSDNSGDGVPWTRKGEVLFAAGTFTTQHYYKRCTAAMAGGGDTITVTGLTNSCAGVLVIYRNALSSGDPYRDWTTQDNASGTESHASVTTQANDWAVLVVGNSPDLAVTPTSPLVTRAERLSTGGTDSSVNHSSFQDTGGGGSGALAWAQTNAISGSIGYSTIPTTDNDRTVGWADVGDSGALALMALAAIEIKAGTGVTLTVDNVTTAQNTGSPALTQTHVLTVANAVTAENTGSPALTQVHNLTPANVVTAESVESPTIAEVKVLAPASVTTAQSTGSPALTQVHNLTVDNVVTAGSIGSPALTQVHQLTVQGLTTAQKTEQPGPGPTLNVISGSRAPDFGGLAGITTDVPHKIAINDFITVDMTDNTFDVTDREVAAAFYGPPNGHTLVYVNTGPTDPDAGTGTVFKTRGVRVWLEQVHVLAVAAVTTAQVLENVTLTEEGVITLTVQSLSTASVVTAPVLTQVHNVSPGNVVTAGSLGTPSLTQVHVLSVNQLVTASAVGTPSVTQVHSLVVAAVVTAGSVESPTLSTELTLAVASVITASSIGSPTLPQVHVLVVGSVTTASVLSQPALTQLHQLLVDNLVTASEVQEGAVVFAILVPPLTARGVHDAVLRADGVHGSDVNPGQHLGTLEALGIHNTILVGVGEH